MRCDQSRGNDTDAVSDDDENPMCSIHACIMIAVTGFDFAGGRRGRGGKTRSGRCSDCYRGSSDCIWREGGDGDQELLGVSTFDLHVAEVFHGEKF